MIKQDDKELREKKVRIRIPHTYVILFSIIVIAAIATYIVPAGQLNVSRTCFWEKHCRTR